MEGPHSLRRKPTCVMLKARIPTPKWDKSAFGAYSALNMGTRNSAEQGRTWFAADRKGNVGKDLTRLGVGGSVDLGLCT